ncbi:fungal-specific transcription factor domain-containing protein [Aspergillus filifer]
MPQQSATGRPVRQQPGLACEECRKRKARCDRAKPQCGSCLLSGRKCIVNYNRPRRGPKKGQIESLYSRLEVLEEQVVDQMEDADICGLDSHDNIQPSHNTHQSTGLNKEIGLLPLYALTPSPSSGSNSFEWSLLPPPSFAPSSSSPIRSSAPDTDLIESDLDQLYFDRVHPIAPFLHQQRHFSQLKAEPLSPARSCLCSAMRTVAAAMSAQFRRLADFLYIQTTKTMRELETVERTPPLQQIQALLLLAHFELLQMDESRAMVTAGKCFRLVQLSRLHDADAYDAGIVRDFSDAEERRRTFWVAYCFDRFLSSRHDWPLTLQEESIWTRLPVPEDMYQLSQLPDVPMDFLHEAIATSGQRSPSPFAECIILATLYGRIIHLRRMAILSLNTASETQDFWARHKALVSILEKRLHLWAWTFPGSAGLADPIIAFTHVLGKAAVMYVAEVADIARARPSGAPGTVVDSGVAMLAQDFDLTTIKADVQGSKQAGCDFLQLCRSMGPINCFKAHPLLPNAIFRAAAYLSTNGPVPDTSFAQLPDQVEPLRQILRDMQTVNNLAKVVLKELDASAFGRSGQV